MKIEESNDLLTIQLRYCFEEENLHSMNAEIFNECEKQFIKIIRSTEKYFEETLDVKIKSRKEGSLIDVFSVAINNPEFKTTAIALIVMFATKFMDSKLSSAKHNTDETSTKLENVNSIKEKIKSGDLTQEEFDYIASNDKDLKRLKSNFFKLAKKDLDVAKIETTAFTNSNSQPIIFVIERNEFDNFILSESFEKTEETQSAKIYIVAPVLIKGKKSASWRGIFDEKPIEFKVSDNDFLQQVYGKQIKLSNGTFINCELKIKTISNFESEETKIYREVINVENYGEDNKPIKLINHRKKQSKINSNEEQLSMFSNT